MMSCDDFLKILVEQGGGQDGPTKAAFEEHHRTCEECQKLVPAYAEYDRVMREPKPQRENDPVRAKVMEYARERADRERFAQEIAALTRRPARVSLLRPLAAAALLVVFAGGFLVGHMVELPRHEVTLSEGHLEAAKLLKKLGDDGWRKHAEAVVADPGAVPAEKEEAAQLLRGK